MCDLVLLDVFCRYKKLAKVVNNYSTPVIPVHNFDVPPYSAGLHRREQSSIHTHVKHTAARIRTHTHTHTAWGGSIVCDEEKSPAERGQ